MSSRAAPTGGTRAADDRRRRVWIGIAIVVVALVAVDLVAQGLDRSFGGSEPGGTSGSEYSTGTDGLAAFATLLTRYGHDVAVGRGPVADDPPRPGTTVFVVEPSVLTADDAAALRGFVHDGGRLVVGPAQPFLRSLSDDPPTWQPAATTSYARFDASLGGLRSVETAGNGSWSDAGAGRTLVGSGGDALVTEEHAGAGEILFVADPSPLENAYLGTADDAALALALAGDAHEPVLFPEGVHGYGKRRGLSALPERWKVALALVALAAVVFAWSRARRFGPPDRNARTLPPARAEYVRALSATLSRTKRHTAGLAESQQWARDRIAERAGLGPDPDHDALARAASSFGCTDDEVAALLAPSLDDTQVMALGHAVARVSRPERTDENRGTR